MSTAPKSFQIELDHFHHQPFQKLSGRVRATGQNKAASLELRIFWFTRGRGDEEASIQHRIAIEPQHSVSEFSWQLPATPYSFAGQLITLAWAVELVDKKENSLDLVPFLLSPSGEELQLDVVSDKSKGQTKQKFAKFLKPRSTR